MPTPKNAFLTEPAPYEEAIAFLEQKPAVSAKVFKALLPELRARALAVTGIEDANTLAEVRAILADIPAGTDWKVAKKQLIGQLTPWLREVDDEGGDNARAIAARAEMILRANTFQAYMVGQHAVMREQEDVFPYWQYLSSGDEKVRPAHQKLNEVVAPANSPLWHDHTPPWQWGCRCRLVPLLADEAEELRREDARKAPEARRVLEGSALRKAESGTLDRGPADQVDIRSDRMRGNPRGFTFDPDALRLPLEDLRGRYDAETWEQFVTAARGTPLEGGATLYDWLAGQAPSVARVAAPAVAAEAAAASASTALGTPLTGKLEPASSLTRKERERVKSVLEVVSSVHGDGPLAQIPVNHSAGKHSGVFRAMRFLDGRTVPHSISYKRSGPWPESTLVHEIGHWLDLAGLGRENRNATDPGGALAELVKIARESEAVKNLRKAANLSVNQRAYYTQADEIFARAYFQFIAEESGNATLLEQVSKQRASFVPDRAWETADFAPIRAKMREVFQNAGWMSPPN